MKLKIKKGDKIRVMAGKDKGREGVVEKVFSKDGTVLVPGVNIYKKHSKHQTKSRQKGIIEMVRPLTLASIALICPRCNTPTRVGFNLQDKEKIRVCRKCEGVI